MAMAALLTPIYGRIAQWAGAQAETALLAIGPLVGFFGSGYFSLFRGMLAELQSTAMRGAGQGFSYNAGRALGAAAPYWIGFWADRSGLGVALGWNAAFFLLGAAVIFALPETRAAELE